MGGTYPPGYWYADRPLPSGTTKNRPLMYMVKQIKQKVCISRFAISTCTARYGRYISVCQVTGTRTARYWAVPPKLAIDFDRRQPIEGEIGHRRPISTFDGRLREKKRRRRRRIRGKERSTFFPHTVLARRSLVRCRRPCPRVIFLPHEETECLPAREKYRCDLHDSVNMAILVWK
ncbi:hypothetical protein BHE74_00005079 [Ensete ventricosum]|nr:hypothetical protein BHE74_00005079 [Ensete ventricosum]